MKQAPTEIRRWTYAVPAAMTVCVLMLSWQSARSGEKDPHEMTALGVIAENVRNCLQRQARNQQDILGRPFIVPGCHTFVQMLRN
jgi:hypothetical protein